MGVAADGGDDLGDGLRGRIGQHGPQLRHAERPGEDVATEGDARLGGILPVAEQDDQRPGEPASHPLDRGLAGGAGQVDHDRVDGQLLRGLELAHPVLVVEQRLDRDHQRGVASQQDHVPGHYDQHLRERGGIVNFKRMTAAPRRRAPERYPQGYEEMPLVGNLRGRVLACADAYDRWKRARRGLGGPGSVAVAGANSAASRRMASATLPRGSSSRTGLPLFTEMGTERDEGMVRSTEVPSTFSTSGRRRPTRESARLTITRMRLGG